MSILQKKIILIGAGIIIILLTFFLVFQKNQETVESLENEAKGYQNRVNFLSIMQMQVNQMEQTAPAQQGEIDYFTCRFPCYIPQEKAIYNLALMMKKSRMRVTAITPQYAQTFLQNSTFLIGQENADVTDGVASASAVEANPDRKVGLHEMVGKVTTYDISVSGSMKQVMKAIDWMADNEERMSVSKVSLTYDTKTGKLAGNMTLNYFELNGNGQPYVVPDIASIAIGTGNIFGTSEK